MEWIRWMERKTNKEGLGKVDGERRSLEEIRTRQRGWLDPLVVGDEGCCGGEISEEEEGRGENSWMG
jgi:hypothetical protein